MLRAVRIHSASTTLSLLVLAGTLKVALAQDAVADSQSPAAPFPAAVHYLAPEQVPKLPSGPKHYVPPSGFAGHDWGEPRSAFTRLPADAALVLAAWTPRHA